MRKDGKWMKEAVRALKVAQGSPENDSGAPSENADARLRIELRITKQRQQVPTNTDEDKTDLVLGMP